MNRKSKGKKGVVEYLLNERENLGTAITLRGNPQVTQCLIKAIERKHKYLSGGLMFAEEEDISDKQKQEIMDAFEEVLFAGLVSTQYNILWVEHSDKGRIELNFVVPRIELKSGNDLDLYSHRRDLPLFDMWKNGINAKYNLADPNDPRRARTMTERTKAARGAGTIVANRNSLDETLYQLVQSGQVKSRVQMLELLEKSGYIITRKNSEGISVKHEDIGKKALRLKGGIYSENFTGTGGIESLSQERKRRITTYDNRVARGETRGNRSTYQKYIQTRFDRHEKRHARPRQIDTPKPQTTQKRDTNNMVAKSNNEDTGRVENDRVREFIVASRRKRKKRFARAKEREVELFKQIKISNIRVSESLGSAEQESFIAVTEARESMEEGIARDARRVDAAIIHGGTKNRSFTGRVRELFEGINGHLTELKKSIKGVVNEIKKMKLFNQAKEQVVSKRIRPKINLSPRR
ncbi:hypothetical protein ACLHDG_14320 [Sulfurovum sp. CS9]|uniref:hypothetical protein n=1 Tax=Sulfurovum sp. CS9 TaxID=3391146 RepID=UPI0039E7540A